MKRLMKPLLSLSVVVLCAGQICSPNPPPPPPGPSASDTPGCSNTCQFAFDGVCDDGGPDSTWSLCDYGTDCNDCGQREVSDGTSDGSDGTGDGSGDTGGGGTGDTGGGGAGDTGGGSSCDACGVNGDWGSPQTIWGFSIDEMFLGRFGGGVCLTTDNHWCKSNLDAKFGIQGLWGTSSTNIYGAGFETFPDASTEGAIVHFDGTQWTKIIKVPGTDTLIAVWGSGPNDIFVGGDDDTRIIHYDGNRWVYQETGTSSEMLSIQSIWGTAYNNVWAVGFYTVGSGINQSTQSAIYHYDGSSWSEDTSLTFDGFLEGIWGTAADDIFAVGFQNVILQPCNCVAPPPILHYDGTNWTKMKTPDGVNDGPKGDVILRAVHGTSASNVWAVGDGGTLLHYDGSQWQKFDSHTTVDLNDVYTPSLNKLFVVGWSLDGTNIVKLLNYNP